MTLDEARRELGVAAADDDERLRRAYLRLLKTRKPDADPVGFQRLREAYEVAREHGSLVVAVEPPGVDLPAAKVVADEDADDADADADAPDERERWQQLRDGFRAAREELAPAPDAEDTVLEVLSLLERHQGKRARKLVRAFGEWVSNVGEIHAVPGGLGVAWRVARDLARLEEYAPAKLVAAFAKSERTGDMRGGYAEAERFRRARPQRAAEIERFMRRSMFGLEHFAAALRGPDETLQKAHAVVDASASSGPSRGWLSLIFPALWLMRFLSQSSAPSTPPPAPPPVVRTSQTEWTDAQRPRALAAMSRLAELKRLAPKQPIVDNVAKGFNPDSCKMPAGEDSALALLKTQVALEPAALHVVDQVIADWAALCGPKGDAK